MSKSVLIIVLAGSLLFMGMMGTGLFLMWSKVSALDHSLNPKSEEEAGENAESEGISDAVGPTYNLDTFIVNTADPGGTRYLRVTMNLELNDELLKEKLDRRLPQIRDSILMILPEKKLSDIQSVEGKNALRTQLMAKLNSFFEEGGIKNLYFTEFVIQ